MTKENYEKGDIIIVSGWRPHPVTLTVQTEEGKRLWHHIRPEIDRSIVLRGARGGRYWLTHRVANSIEPACWEMRSLANRSTWKQVEIK